MAEKTTDKRSNPHKHTKETNTSKAIKYVGTDISTICGNPRLFDKKKVAFVGKIEKVNRPMMVPRAKTSIDDKLPLTGSTDRLVSAIGLKRTVYEATLSIDLKDTTTGKSIVIVIEMSKVGKNSFEGAIALEPDEILAIKGVVKAFKEPGPTGGKWIEGKPAVLIMDYKVIEQ